MDWPRWRRIVLRALLALVLVGALFMGWNTWRLWQAWQSVERVDFDVDATRRALEQIGPAVPPPPDSAEWLDEAFDAFLVIGSDAKAEALGSRADVIMLLLKPTDRSAPILISIPRDLYVTSPCTGEPLRINENLAGCGTEVRGPELIALAVEGYTGIPIDHFALFGLDGFEKVIDKVGGVEICVDRPLRHDFQDLLPAGCTEADGATTLLWIRSRTTTELVDGEWVPLAEEGDLARNQRQQVVLLEMLSKLDSFRSPTSLSRLVEDLSDTFVLDDGLSLTEAVGHAWDLRGLDPDAIKRPVLPIEPAVTDGGDFVVMPSGSFADVLVEVYPPSADVLAGSHRP